MCDIRKVSKKHTGSSLIEEPDVAGVHQDKKNKEESNFIKRRRKRIIRKQGREELELKGGSR